MVNREFLGNQDQYQQLVYRVFLAYLAYPVEVLRYL